ncbi:hypothetical protein DFH08DRAFT_804123 [Mycena albidolilacea]|uniref:Uncharacterized protein n=1 Tax=Mycena albidolilacea TaxID=1033008 RepID=A0AAD7ABF2_9AGAR|nr:hypothetical protein DFH08DRAFT_804123 [Mycena albidolilacea]
MFLAFSYGAVFAAYWHPVAALTRTEVPEVPPLDVSGPSLAVDKVRPIFFGSPACIPWRYIGFTDPGRSEKELMCPGYFRSWFNSEKRSFDNLDERVDLDSDSNDSPVRTPLVARESSGISGNQPVWFKYPWTSDNIRHAKVHEFQEVVRRAVDMFGTAQVEIEPIRVRRHTTLRFLMRVIIPVALCWVII